MVSAGKASPYPFRALGRDEYNTFNCGEPVFFQSLSYKTNEGWGEKSSYTATRPLSMDLRFRYGFNASYYLNDDYFNISSSLSLIQDLSEKAIMVYRFSGSGDTDGMEKVNSYTVATGYRRQLYKNYIYMDFVPEVSWPRSRNFEPTPAVSIKLEMIFGPD